MSELDEVLRLYGRALDEVYALRAMLACEARIAEAHGELKSFPKSRRFALDESVESMRNAASGRGVKELHRNPRYRNYRPELRSVAGSELLTRFMWESEFATPPATDTTTNEGRDHD